MDKSFIKSISKAAKVAMIPCISSNIQAFGYDMEKRLLYVVFNNRALYAYQKVKYEQFLDLLEAQSKGKWVNTNLVKAEVPFTKYTINLS